MKQNKQQLKPPHKVSLLLLLLGGTFALSAFAANSVLCRLALGEQTIDPASFTQIRLVAGALTLLALVSFNRKSPVIQWRRLVTNYQIKNWFAPFMLFTYAISFSFAYVKLNTASGALILFATVQLTMLGVQWLKGHALNLLERLGVVLSITGFVWLMLPGATTPSFTGFVLMTIAGVGWAFYTLLGKNVEAPIIATTENFVRCLPLCLLLLVASLGDAELTPKGIWLAIASGSLASGLGYAVWYFVVRHISITLAAICQLSVPLIAALGGIVFVNESLTLELILPGSLILIGIAVVSLSRTIR